MISPEGYAVCSIVSMVDMAGCGGFDSDLNSGWHGSENGGCTIDGWLNPASPTQVNDNCEHLHSLIIITLVDINMRLASPATKI